jgi:hypothetical protein
LSLLASIVVPSLSTTGLQEQLESYRLRFLIFNCSVAVLWASSMVTLAWLGGRWVPLNRMLEGVVEFGIGALVWWESSQLDSGDGP